MSLQVREDQQISLFVLTSILNHFSYYSMLLLIGKRFAKNLFYILKLLPVRGMRTYVRTNNTCTL